MFFEKKVSLDPRLSKIAEMLGTCVSCADIGSDHGRLGAFLLQNGQCSKVYLTDISAPSLDKARKLCSLIGFKDEVEFRVGDGALALDEKVDSVVIAGMGGETIADILEAAPWTKDNVKLVLQPQTKVEELSLWLDENGYAITDAGLVKDAGRIYLILCAQGGKSRAPFTCAQMYADRILLEKRDPLLPEYLDRLIDIFERRLKGMESSDGVRIDEHDHVMYALRGFRRMKEETEKW